MKCTFKKWLTILVFRQFFSTDGIKSVIKVDRLFLKYSNRLDFSCSVKLVLIGRF